MKLEQQVCSLELSKRLKELNCKQESLFYWASFRNESSPKEQWGNVYNMVLNEEELEECKERDFLRDFSYVSAFTVAELFNQIYQIKIDLWIWHNDGKYLVQSKTHDVQANTESLADALAEILIETQYEKEN